MALDRWIALAFIALCCVYGYAAFFTMDDSLPPILRRNPIWPSTFPKMLAVAGIIVGMMVLFAPKTVKPAAATGDKADGTMDITRLREYQLIPALALVVQSALSGPVIHAPSHQLAQEICNELIY